MLIYRISIEIQSNSVIAEIACRYNLKINSSNLKITLAHTHTHTRHTNCSIVVIHNAYFADIASKSMTPGICSSMVFVTCDVTSSSSLDAPPTTLGCRASNVDRPI